MNKNKFKVVAALFVKYIKNKPYFLLGLRDSNRPAPNSYEFPGGKQMVKHEDGDIFKDVDEMGLHEKCIIFEDPEIAIRREINEELGVDINVKQKIWEGVYTDYDVSLYECELLSENFKLTAHTEIIWRDLAYISKIKNTVLSLENMLPVLKNYENRDLNSN